MWPPTTRRLHRRGSRRHARDLSDAEWRLLEPRRCRPGAPGRCARPATRCSVCCARRRLPAGSPPWRALHRRFARWPAAGGFASVNHHLVLQDRERAGREASPAAAVIDRPSVRARESAGPRGHDAGRTIEGRRRRARVGRDGRGLPPHARPASIQDRGGGPPLLRAARHRWPIVPLRVAEAGTGSRTPAALAANSSPSPAAGSVAPSTPGARWSRAASPRSTATLRLTKAVEAAVASPEAFLHAASVMLRLRRSARGMREWRGGLS